MTILMQAFMVCVQLALYVAHSLFPEHVAAHVPGEIELRSPTVGFLGTASVGVGNVNRRDFDDQTGHHVDTLSIKLYPFPSAGERERVLVVGEGSRFDLGGSTWEVRSLQLDAHDRATVVPVR